MEHTELPWHVTQYKQKSLICIDSTIPDANDITHQICGLEKGKAASNFLEIETHLANAEYIVRACNAFPAMVEAIKEIDNFYENSVGQVITTERAIDAYHKSTMADKIKAALAAGGE